MQLLLVHGEHLVLRKSSTDYRAEERGSPQETEELARGRETIPPVALPSVVQMNEALAG